MMNAMDTDSPTRARGQAPDPVAVDAARAMVEIDQRFGWPTPPEVVALAGGLDARSAQDQPGKGYVQFDLSRPFRRRRRTAPATSFPAKMSKPADADQPPVR